MIPDQRNLEKNIQEKEVYIVSKIRLKLIKDILNKIDWYVSQPASHPN